MVRVVLKLTYDEHASVVSVGETGQKKAFGHNCQEIIACHDFHNLYGLYSLKASLYNHLVAYLFVTLPLLLPFVS